MGEKCEIKVYKNIYVYKVINIPTTLTAASRTVLLEWLRKALAFFSPLPG